MSAKGSLIGVVLVAFMVTSPAAAEKVSRSVVGVDTIEHESGVGRILFRADLDMEDENVAVRRALLRVPLASHEFSRAMTLRVHPVTTEWSRGSVGWTTGWTRPGADFEDLLHGRTEVSRTSEGEIVVDISILVKEIIEHGAPNRGFILIRDPDEGLGLPASDLSGLGSLAGATVQIEWRGRPPTSRRAGE
jgi:hypothetical protein